jgi:hypothetical protein
VFDVVPGLLNVVAHGQIRVKTGNERAQGSSENKSEEPALNNTLAPLRTSFLNRFHDVTIMGLSVGSPHFSSSIVPTSLHYFNSRSSVRRVNFDPGSAQPLQSHAPAGHCL